MSKQPELIFFKYNYTDVKFRITSPETHIMEKFQAAIVSKVAIVCSFSIHYFLYGLFRDIQLKYNTKYYLY